LRFILADRVDKFLRRHVGAEDMNLESGALQHRDHEVLADVVEVPLNVSGDDHAGWLRPCGRQQWPEGLHGRLHRPPRQQELRDKALLFSEELAHLIHRGNHGVCDQRQRVRARFDLLAYGRLRERSLPIHNCVVKPLG